VEVLSVILTSGLLVSTAQAQAPESGAPMIEGTPVTGVSEHGATLEAKVNPRGLETAYELRLVWQDADPPAYGEPVTGGVQAQQGRIAAGSGEQAVSANVTNLKPGYTYWYEAGAINSAGRTQGESPYSFGFHASGGHFEQQLTGPPLGGEMPLFAQWDAELEEKNRQAGAEAEAKVHREEEAAAAALTKRREEEAATTHKREEGAGPKKKEEAPATESVYLAGRNIVVQGKGVALVKVECLGKDRCRGKLTLTTPRRARPKAATTTSGAAASPGLVGFVDIPTSYSDHAPKTGQPGSKVSRGGIAHAPTRECHPKRGVLSWLCVQVQFSFTQSGEGGN